MKRRVYGTTAAFLLLGMLVLAFSIRPADAEPATIVVPDDYPTIQEAINNANSGDTVFVKNGTYDENVVVNKSLILTGEDRETTIIDGGGREKHVANVKASNTVIKDFTIRRSGTHDCGVYLNHASNSSVLNTNIIDNDYALVASCSPDSQIFGNIVHNNVKGIYVFDSSRSHVFSNNITYSTLNRAGIFISHSFDVCMFGNNITGTWYGVVTHDSHDTLILGNSIIKNRIGIMLSTSDSSIINQNDITSNYLSIYFEGHCYNNKIYHNNFINNTLQIPDINASYINKWDDDYLGGGNYWSDYNGTDLYSGSFQNVTGSDGIGDVPYVIDESNTDNYPLMEPYTSTHAIAVGYVWSDRTALGQGNTANIDVSIVNYGRFTENFNLTVYTNTTIIHHTEVTLAGWNTATLTFAWNTTGVAKGNYTITAAATPVLGETDTSDNNITCWVIVSMLGDLTGPDGWPDGQVDMRDLGLAARAFGSYPGHERWNLEADITGPEYLVPDKQVNMRDIALIARHFGETDP